ncbi:MAG TPA: YceD family protein [bacterium]|jgi:uncharacterized protein
MKIHLAQIPEEGVQRSLRLKLGAMARLSEAIGEQSGELLADLRIKNRDGNVEIVGHLRTRLQPPCQRCLEPVPLEIDEPVRVALVSQSSYDDAPEDAHLGQGELELSFYQDEELDLSHILEDELLLLLPEPVAEEDEEGRCVVCGRRIDELLPAENDADAAHPFAGLKGLLDND